MKAADDSKRDILPIEIRSFSELVEAAREYGVGFYLDDEDNVKVVPPQFGQHADIFHIFVDAFAKYSEEARAYCKKENDVFKIEKLDVAAFNRRLKEEDEVECPKGTYLIWETIVVPPGKRLRGHPEESTLLMAFDGPAIIVKEPAVQDCVTGINISECEVAQEWNRAQPVEKVANLPFPKARRTMAQAFREDEGLYQGYVDNVAMLLHDRYGITDPVTRNEAADAILKLIFEGKR